VLVYFSDHKTDSANADLFKIWGRKYKLPVIYGYDVLDGVSVAKEKVKESNKVLLFVTDLGNTKDFLKKIIECKVDNNIVLFTTHHLNSEICIYAKKKGHTSYSFALNMRIQAESFSIKKALITIKGFFF
jgi:hypothetical protein